MRPNTIKAALIKSGLAASFLLLASGASLAQTTPQPVNLTAAPTAYTAPDGSAIPPQLCLVRRMRMVTTRVPRRRSIITSGVKITTNRWK